MSERVYATEENKATLICPRCRKSKTVDVSQFADKHRAVKIKSRCLCGHQWTSVLEKRKKYRKPVDLSGTYDLIKNEKTVDRGGVKVLDLSLGGVKLKLNADPKFQTGDHLTIEFRLDNSRRTLLKKQVTVRNISGRYVGATFRKTEAYDPELGFYLMADKRGGEDRRLHPDRRKGDDSAYNGPEKRGVKYRRSGDDRRQSDSRPLSDPFDQTRET